MKIAILVFDRLTALDAIGPYEVLSRLPDAELSFVAKQPGMKRTDTGSLGINADRALGEVPDPDLLLVPGGNGNRPLLADQEVLDWIRTAHEQTKWTTSVCTGALVLGAERAQLLAIGPVRGRPLAVEDAGGAEPVAERFVADGKVVTAAGVSAGIDMALHLVALEYGELVAQGIQLGIEYDPQPPFDSGSPEKADPQLVEVVRQVA